MSEPKLFASRVWPIGTSGGYVVHVAGATEVVEVEDAGFMLAGGTVAQEVRRLRALADALEAAEARLVIAASREKGT